MNKALGILLILISAALSLYAVYLLAGNGWAMLAGAFLLYCVGYHMVTAKRPAREEKAETAAESFVRQAHDEVARKRGMN
jgi:Ca2+/Na+ antiporter